MCCICAIPFRASVAFIIFYQLGLRRALAITITVIAVIEGSTRVNIKLNMDQKIVIIRKVLEFFDERELLEMNLVNKIFYR